MRFLSMRWFVAASMMFVLGVTAGWRLGAGGAGAQVAATPGGAACLVASPAATPIGTPAAGHGGHGGDAQHDQGASEESPYAGTYDPTAPIRALTADEVAQIRRGEGAGFALPAELNGVPGPRHVLDLAEQLGLSAEQRAAVQAVYDQMRAAAIPVGERYLAAAQELEEGFRCGTLTEATLPGRVAEVSRLRGELATVHLLAHLKTAKLLTAEQIATYNRLRGYR